MVPESASSGRPANFVRDEAIARAMHLFWREGYLSVTSRDLAQAMGIQRSSFYNSFGDKEKVFLEALGAYTKLAPDSALDQIEPGQAVIPAIVETLRELCRVRSADKESRGCLVCNSVAELVGVHENLGVLLDDAVQQRIAVMERLFEQASNQKEIEPGAALPDLARSFVTFLLGLNSISKSIRDEQELWSICRVFLGGIGIESRKDGWHAEEMA